jgi:hypothetical protein
MDLCAAMKLGSTSRSSDQPELSIKNAKYRYDIPRIETVEDAPHSSDVAVASGPRQTRGASIAQPGFGLDSVCPSQHYQRSPDGGLTVAIRYRQYYGREVVCDD